MINVEDITNKIICADCLEYMKKIPDKSIDMILCDLPYGTTACSWDIIIPFDKLWEQYKRIRKDNTPIVLFGREPFTSRLVMSNVKEYKHKWIWNKKQTGSFANARYMPHQIDEDIIIFCSTKVNYYPIMRKGKMRKKGGCKTNNQIQTGLKTNYITQSDDYYPVNIIEFTKERGLHPTQKPVALFEYLIKTYTKEGDLVLDNCSGSGTTAIACHRLNRRFICIEKDPDYWAASVKRLEDVQKQGELF